jgi:hypothetical protein
VLDVDKLERFEGTDKLWFHRTQFDNKSQAALTY